MVDKQRSVAIMQPYFFPYLGYFQLIQASDTFVFYDDVNYIKRGWINRNKILINSADKYLTIPLIGISQNKKINELKVENQNKAIKKILKSIELAYKKAPQFELIFPIIKQCFEFQTDSIADLNITAIKKICDYLELERTFKVSSNLEKNTSLRDKENKLIDIVQIFQGNHYVNAIGGKSLYSKANFEKEGIKLNFLEPKIKPYKQFNNSYLPNLSIIDVLMFNSKFQVKEMICDYNLI